MKTLLPILLILSSSSLALAQNTEFVAPRADEPLPIVIGDADGRRTMLKEFALPVYFGYPVRSYRILGTVVAHGPSTADHEVSRPEALQSVVSTAKAHGAEAVVMLRLTPIEQQQLDADGHPWILAKALAVRWRRPGDS